MKTDYEFTNNWFQVTAEAAWTELFPKHYQPQRVLEIGSYEGQSACWLAERNRAMPWGLASIECIDTWEGSPEHAGDDMEGVYRRFCRNANNASRESNVKVWRERRRSSEALLDYSHNLFDLIYIDGSHAASDVLTDAVLAWPLLRVGGLMIFDDYLWSAEPRGEQDMLNAPKLAVDSFVNCFFRKLKILALPSTQVYIEKVTD